MQNQNLTNNQSIKTVSLFYKQKIVQKLLQEMEVEVLNKAHRHYRPDVTSSIIKNCGVRNNYFLGMHLPLIYMKN